MISFRVFQNKVNALSRKLDEVQRNLVALIKERESITGSALGPRGNEFDLLEWNRLSNSIAELTEEESEIAAELADVRAEMTAAMAMIAAA